MDAFILAGGFGTRLRPVLADRPKPMAIVAERPFLEYLLLQLRNNGLTDVTLCIGFQGRLIQEYFKCRGVPDIHLRYSSESEPLGTGGALKLAEPLIRTTNFIVLNGDSFFNIDLHTLVAFHLSRKARATVALAEVEDIQRYGSVEVNSRGEILRFQEKGQAGQGFINTGIYVFCREMLALIPPGQAVSLEREVLPQLIGHGFYGLSFQGYFIDIGTPSDYLKLQTDPSHLLAVTLGGGDNADPCQGPFKD